MRRSVISIFIFLCFSIESPAQKRSSKKAGEAPLVKFEFTVYDTSNNHFFREHHGVDWITFHNRDKELPRFIGVGASGYDLFFDLGFKGDSLAFSSQYKDIRYLGARASLRSINGIQDWGSPTVWEIAARISKDSMVYTAAYWNVDRLGDVYTGTAARLLGEYRQLAQQIADDLRLGGMAAVTDSVIVLEGVIGKRRQVLIRDLELLVGERSAFSDIALRVIGNDGNRWYPATTVSGKRVRSRYKLYIELHADGSVTVLPPIYADAINPRIAIL